MTVLSPALGDRLVQQRVTDLKLFKVCLRNDDGDTEMIIIIFLFLFIILIMIITGIIITVIIQYHHHYHHKTGHPVFSIVHFRVAGPRFSPRGLNLFQKFSLSISLFIFFFFFFFFFFCFFFFSFFLSLFSLPI